MLQRLQQTLERERRFVDDASHELRTPLATLRGEIDLALARPRSAVELESSLWSALEDVIRLQRLADDLLVLARSRGGQIPVRLVQTTLIAVLERGARAVESTARDADVKITVAAPDKGIEVDPERIEQAVRNLLENAIRHTPRGETVRLTGVQADGRIQIVVEDAGPGFPPDMLEVAFDPFVSGDGQVEGETRSGAGLGLAIVRAVAEAHGGSVAAGNGPAGARVMMDLPA
jgi:signal transduction histidine kinase